MLSIMIPVWINLPALAMAGCETNEASLFINLQVA